MKSIRLFNKVNVTLFSNIYRDAEDNKIAQIVFNFFPALVLNIVPEHFCRTQWELIFSWIIFTIQIDNDEA